jgi:hypothetical protein
MHIGNRDHRRLPHQKSFFNDEIDGSPGVGIVDGLDCSHGGKDTTPGKQPLVNVAVP